MSPWFCEEIACYSCCDLLETLGDSENSLLSGRRDRLKPHVKTHNITNNRIRLILEVISGAVCHTDLKLMLPRCWTCQPRSPTDSKNLTSLILRPALNSSALHKPSRRHPFYPSHRVAANSHSAQERDASAAHLQSPKLRTAVSAESVRCFVAGRSVFAAAARFATRMSGGSMTGSWPRQSCASAVGRFSLAN